MRVAIYNPYLDTLGGGERYTMAAAQAFVSAGYEVHIEWKSEKVLKKLEERFGIRHDKRIKIIPDIKRGDGYETCFWVSDGSIPLLRARNNFLHFQFPFRKVRGRSLINKMKLFRVKAVICNSEFTKRFIDREYGVESTVVYPPVSVTKFRAKRKENMILYVGRFSNLAQAKRQDVLISVFKKFFDRGQRDWRLALAGGVEVGVGKYLKSLKKKANGYPVEFIESPSFKNLQELYGKAELFWSASGYGVDWEEVPSRAEHFGITVVEAMSAGAVPLVYNAGGHKEIVSKKFLWRRKSDLLKKTQGLIGDKKALREASKKLRERSRAFSEEEFRKKFLSLL